MTTCKNCGHQFDLNYCPSCGQKASVKKLEMKSLLQELPNALWHLDRGFLYNCIELFKRPGYAIKDYLDGKRKRFYHPLSFMLIILGTMYVLMNLMQVHYYDPIQDAGMSETEASVWKEYDATQQAWIRLYKWYIPFYLPWMSLVYWTWLRVMKMKYTYAESIVIALFSSSQMTIPQIPLLVLAWAIKGTMFTRISDQVLNWGVIALIYFFQFYQLGNPSFSKGRRIFFSVTGTLVMVAFAFSMIYLFLEFANAVGL
jgi:hypothetical protein